MYPPGYNFLTAQPLRRRTSDGEVSWDQPGPLFDPAEDVGTSAFNEPLSLRTPIGHLVARPNVPAYAAADIGTFCNGKPNGSLVVYNRRQRGHRHTERSWRRRPESTEELLDEDGVPIEELEAPVNEEDFFRDPAATQGVANPLRPYIGRRGAEVLGKALFWDMQVGSDGVSPAARATSTPESTTAPGASSIPTSMARWRTSPP